MSRVSELSEAAATGHFSTLMAQSKAIQKPPLNPRVNQTSKDGKKDPRTNFVILHCKKKEQTNERFKCMTSPRSLPKRTPRSEKEKKKKEREERGFQSKLNCVNQNYSSFNFNSNLKVVYASLPFQSEFLEV